MAGWLMFVLAGIVGALLLYVPGTVLLHLFRVPWNVSLIASAPVTVGIAQVLFLAYSHAHIPVTLLTFVLPLTIILGIAQVAQVLMRKKAAMSSHESAGKIAQGSNSVEKNAWNSLRTVLALPRSRGYLMVTGTAVVLLLFQTIFFVVSRFDGPDSFVQNYDVPWHYSIIKWFMEKGDFSATRSGAVVPTEGGTFYPTGWHALVALTAMLTGASIPLAANAINTIVICVVWPISVYALIRWVMRKPPVQQLWPLAFLLSGAFAAFPWRFMSFGPLYSNMFSNVMLPVLLLFGLVIFSPQSSWSTRFHILPLFALTAVGSAMAQPNVIFTTAVILAVYVVFRIPAYCSAALTHQSVAARVAMSVVIEVLFLSVVAVVWKFLYGLEFLQRTVTFTWPHFLRIRYALLNMFAVSAAGGAVAWAPQYILMVLVTVGAIWTLWHRQYLWITASYAVFAGFWVLSASQDNDVKHLLTGFWYTDHYRLAAATVFSGIFLAAFGLSVILLGLAKIVMKGHLSSAHNIASSRSENNDAENNELVALISGNTRRSHIAAVCVVLFTAVCLLVNMVPSFTLAGDHHQLGFEDVIEHLEDGNKATGKLRSYTQEERQFVKKVKAIVGNSVVLNQPYDGSAFMYALDNVNIFFKAFDANWMGHPSNDMWPIMQRLYDYSTDAQVRAAVKKSGARYVLLMDRHEYRFDKNDGYWHGYTNSYMASMWTGFDKLKPSTPGFTLVLEEGNNRLYRIDE
ncbi:DUF6541 family protein [Aeriscardovia aeriphila]|uniref:Beta-carotene 15,15'-monooxygenase n=1 Tax=Aeriscardovia aeriphila TaxID=218139 RepID=A0A261F7Z2_9BIFI|nr:DUF6541 family protein [Aeriscardovia aeriphila]NYI25267.1 hypothetical protein [Aeriscardovia aeriphila]OZG55185.1 hypothetical protein AEAE_1163 [Aeriscardovia aeriphila]